MENRNGFFPNSRSVNRYNANAPRGVQTGGSNQDLAEYSRNGLYVAQGISAWDHLCTRIELEPTEALTWENFMGSFLDEVRFLIKRRVKSRRGTKVCNL
jgi:hypothetical protein